MAINRSARSDAWGDMEMLESCNPPSNAAALELLDAAPGPKMEMRLDALDDLPIACENKSTRRNREIPSMDFAELAASSPSAFGALPEAAVACSNVMHLAVFASS